MLAFKRNSWNQITVCDGATEIKIEKCGSLGAYIYQLEEIEKEDDCIGECALFRFYIGCSIDSGSYNYEVGGNAGEIYIR